MKRRIVYFLLTCSCFVVCALIVILFGKNQFVRGFTGDVIIIFLIYFLIKVAYDFDVVKLSAFVLVIAYITEFLQYLNVISFVGLQGNKIAQIVIGSVFDPYDMLAYTIGAIIVCIIDAKLIKGILLYSK